MTSEEDDREKQQQQQILLCKDSNTGTLPVKGYQL